MQTAWKYRYKILETSQHLTEGGVRKQSLNFRQVLTVIFTNVFQSQLYRMEICVFVKKIISNNKTGEVSQ
jgi:hypothetical protein